jgi:methylase of polypeptide subunit release factors
MGAAARGDTDAGIDGDLTNIAESMEVLDAVFAPAAGSIAVAAAIRGRSGSFLDLGTGTGFLSIIMAESADAVLATDCSHTALECAARNFRRFGIDAEVRRSDRFDRIPETFDCIAFNPPIFRNETEFARQVKNRLKRILPGGVSAMVSALARPIFERSLRSVVTEFYREGSRHLNPGGVMVVNVLSPDTRWLSALIAGRARLTERRRAATYCIVEIAPIVGDGPGATGAS